MDSRRLKMWIAVLATFAVVLVVWSLVLRLTLPGDTALGEEKNIFDEAQKSWRGVGGNLRNRVNNLGEVLQVEKNDATSSVSLGATTTQPGT